jgi:hypothetical protein
MPTTQWPIYADNQVAGSRRLPTGRYMPIYDTAEPTHLESFLRVIARVPHASVKIEIGRNSFIDGSSDGSSQERESATTRPRSRLTHTKAKGVGIAALGKAAKYGARSSAAASCSTR